MSCWKKWKRLPPAAPDSILIMQLTKCWMNTSRKRSLIILKAAKHLHLQVAQEELADQKFQLGAIKDHADKVFE